MRAAVVISDLILQSSNEEGQLLPASGLSAGILYQCGTAVSASAHSSRCGCCWACIYVACSGIVKSAMSSIVVMSLNNEVTESTVVLENPNIVEYRLSI